MTGIVKRFGTTLALDGVDLALDPGLTHALVGENGAGKTTLMQILAGLLRPDAGRISVRGREVAIGGVDRAFELGIGMVHQHFMLFPSLTVAENLTIGHEPRRRGLFDRAAAELAVTELSERYGLAVDPRARVGGLGVGTLQRVEILRALFRGARILILDEPTAILTPQEAEGLFRVVRDLNSAGATTVFISHRLEEVLEIADAITVLRDGRVSARLDAAATDARELARAMVGREVLFHLERGDLRPGRPVLELRGISAAGLRDIDLTVHAGEVVGVAGVAGNGQSELAEVIAGLQPAWRGQIQVDGTDVTARDVAGRRAAGLAYVPDDRYRRGLAPDASIADNLLMGRQRGKDGRRRLLDRGSAKRRTERLLAWFKIRTDDPDRAVRTLSGGNAQRVVVARELADPGPLVVAAQPTRGIDVAASEFVRQRLLERRDGASGVLLISADLAEIRAMADRIVVLHAGRIAGEMTAAGADDEHIGLLMAGSALGGSRDPKPASPGGSGAG
jgi:simple sugar transport system ATP-binding protein